MTARRPLALLYVLCNRPLKTGTAFVLYAGLGMIWGLALARALAESFLASPTFELGPTLLLALAVAVAVAVAGWWLDKQLAANVQRSATTLFIPLLLTALYLFWPDVAPRVGWTLLGGSLALTVLLIVGQARAVRGAGNAILPYLLACVTLALYLRTLGPTVGQADTFEFQVVAPTLGIAHPTGYPLYILSGKLFSLLPVGSSAWRVNLSSAVFATLAVVTVYQLVRRLSQPSGYFENSSRIFTDGRSAALQALRDTDQNYSLVALIAALSFAFSRLFWSQAVVAEVYALHNLFVAAILLLLASSPKRLLYALAFLLGLSFTNHLTTALLLPAVGLTLLFAHPRTGLKGWLVAAGLFVLGLSLYLYIYVKWPMLHDGVWMSPGEFWRYVTGQQFGGALKLNAWRTDPTRYQIIGRLLREPFGWPGWILGAAGLLWLAIKKWRVALITGITFLAYAWYALSYYVPDVAVFLLPAHLILAVWMGLGLAALVPLGRSLQVRLTLPFRSAFQASRPERSVGAGTIVISLSALIPLSLLWTNLPLVDQSGEREAYAWGDRVLDLPLAPGAAILADSARIAPLYYLQHIEGRRPDLDMLVLADEATYRAELETRLSGGQTVYLARFLPGLEGLYHLRSLGPLTEVGTAPLTEPPALDHDMNVRFGSSAQESKVELLGFSGPTLGPDGGTGLTLYWRADAPVSKVYHVRLRLLDAAGQVWWQSAGRHAANNYYPLPAWHPGEIVADYIEIPPLFAGPADCSVQVGLFRPFSDEGLVTNSGELWTTLTQLNLNLKLKATTVPVIDKSTPTRLLRARFDDKSILKGIDLPDAVTAGSPVELRLHWHSSAAGQLSPAWTDSAGNRIAAQILEQWGDSRLSLQAPTTPGDYDLRLGLVDQDGQFIPARCGWLARPSQHCTLATLHVTETTATALANFDGQMLLLDAELGISALRPGQNVPLTLHWQGLQPMAADYTVSVQLVGPDGRLQGQIDAWPVQGTLPTTQWSPGQPIVDPYTVPLLPDAPPGRYRVGVVIYLLATQTRLPLLDESGQAIGDIAWIGEVMVDSE